MDKLGANSILVATTLTQPVPGCGAMPNHIAIKNQAILASINKFQFIPILSTRYEFDYNSNRAKPVAKPGTGLIYRRLSKKIKHMALTKLHLKLIPKIWTYY